VIDSYYNDADDKNIGIEEAYCVLDSGFNVGRADWVVDLHERFETLYGYKQGIDVTNKVLTSLLTAGETCH